jgi:predicted membrane protein
MTKRDSESLSAGILLIGIGILFLVPGLSFWPWILVVIGLAGLPASLANQKGWLGWQGFFWLTGLAILFELGALWPGILILIGISMIAGALTRESEGSPFRRAESKENDEPFSVGDED